MGRRLRVIGVVVCAVLLGACTEESGGTASPTSTVVTTAASAGSAPAAADGASSDGQSSQTSASTSIPSAPLPDPVFTQVPLPGVLDRAQPFMSSVSVVSATPDAPAAMAGLWSTSADSRSVRVWTLGDDWQPQDFPVVGTPEWVDLSASTDLSVLTVGTRVDAHIVMSMFTSTDRVAWTPIGTPAPIVDGTDDVTAAVGRTVFQVSTSADRDGEVLAIRDGVASRYPFPRVSDQREYTSLIAGHDAEVLTVEQLGQDGPLVSRVSTDTGATWSPAHPLADHLATIAGVVWDGSRYLATGSRPAAAGGPVRPAAWSSPDGVQWTEMAIGTVEGRPTYFSGGTLDSWLSAPAVTGTTVAALAADEGRVVSAVFRPTDVAWQSTEVSEPGADAGRSAVVAFATPGADGTDPTPLVVTRYDHGVRTQVGTGSQARVLAPLGQVDPMFEPVRLDDGATDGITRVVMHKTSISVSPDEDWHRALESGAWDVTGGQLGQVPWDPPELSDRHVIVRDTDASGAEVLLASGWTTSGLGVSSYYRAADTEAWRPTAGFNLGPWVAVRGVRSTVHGWVAYGYIGQTRSQAMVWTSPDGISWTSAAEIRLAATVSSIVGSCIGDAGAVVLVGSSTDDAGLGHPFVWSYDGQKWTRGGGFAVDDTTAIGSCAYRDGTFTAVGQREGKTRLYTSTDGVAFTAVAPNPAAGPPGSAAGTSPDTAPGQAFGITQIAGGLVELGYLRSADYWGWVYWLSTDGVTWRWVGIPSDIASGSLDTHAEGDDMTILLSGQTGSEVWQITGLRAALGT